MIPGELVSFIRAANRLAVLTGAGISAESGIATFREAQSHAQGGGQALWSQYRPEDLATPQGFRRNPKLVWDWYAWRRELVAQAQPNPGHYALAELEALATRRGAQFTLITQNVDGLHQRAGSRSVIELHGNITRVKCFDEGTVVAEWTDAGDTPPRCPRCGGLLRPDVVWFGESLPPGALEASRQAALTCDLFFSVGTSAMVQPAASLPLLALEQGTVVVEVNPNPTPLTMYVTHTLRGPAGVMLPELVRAIREKRPSSE